MMPIPYSAEEMVVRAIRNAWPRKCGKVPRWAAVVDVFGLGSTYAMLLCRGFGLDPHEQIGCDGCEQCSEEQS